MLLFHCRAPFKVYSSISMPLRLITRNIARTRASAPGSWCWFQNSARVRCSIPLSLGAYYNYPRGTFL
ncbi:hypothetical protein XENTR_v10015161 [Xenopus tropicalis]|nr:hypothetical protein XENTR_v10015161 [Xenopus tropicalis]